MFTSGYCVLTNRKFFSFMYRMSIKLECPGNSSHRHLCAWRDGVCYNAQGSHRCGHKGCKNTKYYYTFPVNSFQFRAGTWRARIQWSCGVDCLLCHIPTVTVLYSNVKHYWFISGEKKWIFCVAGVGAEVGCDTQCVKCEMLKTCSFQVGV